MRGSPCGVSPLKPYMDPSSSEMRSKYSRWALSSTLSSDSASDRSGSESAVSPGCMLRAANSPQPPKLLRPTRTVEPIPCPPRSASQRENPAARSSCSEAASARSSLELRGAATPAHSPDRGAQRRGAKHALLRAGGSPAAQPSAAGSATSPTIGHQPNHLRLAHIKTSTASCRTLPSDDCRAAAGV